MDPGAEQLTMLKNIPPQINECSKNDSQIIPQKVMLFLGWRLVGHLWVPNQFFNIKSVPSASKMLSMIEN
jgi:hypothetical protein